MTTDRGVKTPMASNKLGVRLHFLDGLRGLACLYVLLFHASNPNIPYGGELSNLMRFVTLCLSCGHFSVVFFIVLSGFSIMLPIARTGTLRLNGGLGQYVRRRARRILPPYYVAVILSIALILGYQVMSHGAALGPPVKDGALGAGPLISHALLIHNVRFDWAYRINGPLWSVATEWQIYFLFALLLLPLWRLTGSAITLALAWAPASLLFFLLPPQDNFFWACPWFLGSFMLGAWGAVVTFSPSHRDSWLRTRAPCGALAWLSFLLIVVLVGTGRANTWGLPVVDFIVSVFALVLIGACADRSTNWPVGKPSLLLRVLGSRVLVYLGGFSYSLYLVQHPVLRFAEKLVAKLTTNRDANIQIHLLMVVPVTVFLAWLFAEFFERPFTTGGLILPAVRRRRAVAPSESAS
jgi:peptidoglycan/LPS O-acetylase OafA/YrhL